MGAEQVFCMQIYKSLPQEIYLLFSDNALHFTSAELVTGKRYSPGAQNRTLQCYPPLQERETML